MLKLIWTYLRKSTTLESGKKCTPVLGRRHPYLFRSSREASRGDVLSSSLGCLPAIIMFSNYFMIFKNSSKLSLPSEFKSRLLRRLIASWGSLPRLLIIVCKSATSMKPLLSLSNISNIHLKLSISSSEYSAYMFYSPSKSWISENMCD